MDLHFFSLGYTIQINILRYHGNNAKRLNQYLVIHIINRYSMRDKSLSRRHGRGRCRLLHPAGQPVQLGRQFRRQTIAELAEILTHLAHLIHPRAGLYLRSSSDKHHNMQRQRSRTSVSLASVSALMSRPVVSRPPARTSGTKPIGVSTALPPPVTRSSTHCAHSQRPSARK